MNVVVQGPALLEAPRHRNDDVLIVDAKLEASQKTENKARYAGGSGRNRLNFPAPTLAPLPPA